MEKKKEGFTRKNGRIIPINKKKRNIREKISAATKRPQDQQQA